MNFITILKARIKKKNQNNWFSFIIVQISNCLADIFLFRKMDW